MDYYNLLKVPVTASQELITQAYRKLAQQLHPDRGGDAEKFTELQQAYEILGDPQTRAEYDKFGLISPEYEAAVVKLKTIVVQMIINGDIENDLVFYMRQNIRTAMAGAQALLLEHKRRDKKLHKARDRLRVAKYGRNVLAEAIDDELKRVAFQIDEIYQQVQTYEKMLDILQNYEYQVTKFLGEYYPCNNT